MKLSILIFFISLTQLSLAQNVGIGTTTPNAAAQLHVETGSSLTKGFLVTGNYNSSATFPDLGSGSRLMFYPGKSAFRAGYASGTNWDNDNVGKYSVATGLYTKASGYSSTAMGNTTTASGDYSTALGFQTTASGYASIAMGDIITVTGYHSMAMGYGVTASGDNATAMGYHVDANMQGVFAIGDANPTNEGLMSSSLTNTFIARFYNGYYLLTSGNDYRSGVQITHGGNAWVSMCDVNLKENFQPLNGEEVLDKISKIKFTSWNYKHQDPKTFRHYGIMAQDFYDAFGHDNYGTIGNDTTVNPIDMIGIDMTAIQALEKRTTAIQRENGKLKIENAALKSEVNALNHRLTKLEALLQKK